MTLEEKKNIAATAKRLIELLDSCDDGDFIDKVLYCVMDSFTVPLEEVSE